MSNHFHLPVKIRNEEDIGVYLPLKDYAIDNKTLSGRKDSDRFYEETHKFQTTGNLPEFEKPGRVLEDKKSGNKTLSGRKDSDRFYEETHKFQTTGNLPEFAKPGRVYEDKKSGDKTLSGRKDSDRFYEETHKFQTTGNLPEFEKPGRVYEPKKPIPSHHFSHLFNAYTKAINQQNSRKGPLFCKPFKRIQVNDIDYFRKLILYIHNNPVKHGFVTSCSDYPWSSYGSVISLKSTKIERGKILGWFNDKANFINAHERKYIDLEEIFMLE